MACLAHRSGLVDGEGDGAGVLTDVPRALWARHLERAGRDPALVRTDRFAVGHLFVPPDADRHTIPAILARHGVAIALTREDEIDASALGPRGRTEAPRFLQLALLLRRGGRGRSRRALQAALDIQRETQAAVVAPSPHHPADNAPRGG